MTPRRDEPVHISIRDATVEERHQLSPLVELDDLQWATPPAPNQTHNWKQPTLIVAATRREVCGVALATPSLWFEHRLNDPWWSLDAVVVAPTWQNHGLGASLVAGIVHRARTASVSCLYGLCAPKLADWYRQLGFDVSAPSEQLDTGLDVNYQRLLLTTENECWISRSFS